jgi:hypothetical protein
LRPPVLATKVDQGQPWIRADLREFRDRNRGPRSWPSPMAQDPKAIVAYGLSWTNMERPTRSRRMRWQNAGMNRRQENETDGQAMGTRVRIPHETH